MNDSIQDKIGRKESVPRSTSLRLTIVSDAVSEWRETGTENTNLPVYLFKTTEEAAIKATEPISGNMNVTQSFWPKAAVRLAARV